MLRVRVWRHAREVATVALLGALVGCQCGGRVVETSVDEEAEERRLCSERVERARTCMTAKDIEPEESFAESLDRCLEHFFREEVAPCRDVAVAAVSCEAAISCDTFPEPACSEESRPFSVCLADPGEWQALGCDASKCPGVCCGG